jgi:hypothetical protein
MSSAGRSLNIVVGREAEEVLLTPSAPPTPEVEVLAQTQQLDVAESIQPLEPASVEARVSSRLFIKSVPKTVISVASVYTRAFLAQVGSQTYSGSAQALLQFSGPKDRTAYVYVYDYDARRTYVSRANFDSNGRLPVLVQSSEEGGYLVVVSLVPIPTVLARPTALSTLSSTPLATAVKLTFWHVRSSLRNKTDVWARWHGRAVYNLPLPGIFWTPPTNFARYVVGLAGGLDWREIVPVVQDMNVGYQVGVSAFCNTTDPSPPASVCCEARKNTWWLAKIMARKSVKEEWRTVGQDDINLSFRITAYFTTDSYSYKGRCVNREVSCGWEQGPSC